MADQSTRSSGSKSGLLVVLVVLLLGLPCVAGVVLVGGGVLFYWAARDSAVEEAVMEAQFEQSRTLPVTAEPPATAPEAVPPTLPDATEAPPPE